MFGKQHAAREKEERKSRREAWQGKSSTVLKEFSAGHRHRGDLKAKPHLPSGSQDSLNSRKPSRGRQVAVWRQKRMQWSASSRLAANIGRTSMSSNILFLVYKTSNGLAASETPVFFFFDQQVYGPATTLAKRNLTNSQRTITATTARESKSL